MNLKNENLLVDPIVAHGREPMPTNLSIEQAAKDVKTARRTLKSDLARRNRTSKEPSRNERRLRAIATKAAESLEAAPSGLGPEIGGLANPET